MKKFDRLSEEERDQVREKYQIPKDTSKIFVDGKGVPHSKNKYGYNVIILKPKYFLCGGFHSYD